MTGLSELGKILHEEHFRIIMVLCDLEHRITGKAAFRSLDPRCEVDRGWLRDLLFCLDQIVDHNAFEEDELFPMICAHGEGELAALLIDEHEAIGPCAKRLHAIALEIIEAGMDAQRWDDFKTVGLQLISEMMFHLQKEEMTVVQRLEVFLDARADHQLALKHVAERPPIRSQGQIRQLSIVMPSVEALTEAETLKPGMSPSHQACSRSSAPSSFASADAEGVCLETRRFANARYQ